MIDPTIPAPVTPTSGPVMNGGKIASYIAMGLFFATFALAQLVPLYPQVKLLAALSALAGAGFRAVTYYIDGKAPKASDL